MKYRQLGATGLKVSEISLGSWLTYGGGVDKSRAVACVRAALDAGVNFIDTANVYGRGAAESLLGELLEPLPRDSYVLATKLYFPMTAHDQGLSRAQVFKQLDASLKRLRTDYVDLYYCHRFDRDTPLGETMQALTEVLRAGKVRHLGFSEWPVRGIRAAAALPGVARFAASQPQYSMLWRKPEREVIPLCRDLGISQVVWSPLAQGLLTGKYLPGAPIPAGARAASSTMGGFFPREWLESAALGAVQKLLPLSRKAGLTLAQFALAWVLREPNVASAIIGATHPEQVAENVKASDASVDPGLFAEADAILKPYAALL